MWRSVMAAALLVLLGNAEGRADVEDLGRFLSSVEEATAVGVPMRGDGTLEIMAPESTTHTDLTVIIRPGTDQYFEIRQPPSKLLILHGADQAYQLSAGLSSAESVAPGTALFGSDFTREDLNPFRVADYRGWRIADEGAKEVTVFLFPKSAQYSQVVVTFDVEKKVPIKILYYKDTLNNLVKVCRDNELVLVGRKWVPTNISMETFKQRTQTRMKLRWTEDVVFPAELFDPLFLPRTLLTRPTQTASTPAAR